MIKKHLMAVLLIGILAPSGAAHSGVPGIDVAKVAALMKERFDELTRFQESMDAESERLNEKAENDAAEIDALNAGASGYVLRETQVQSDLFNMKRMLESLPTQMACEQVTVQANLDTILCNARKKVAGLTDDAESIDNPAEKAQRGPDNPNNAAKAYGYEDVDGDGAITNDDVEHKIASQYFGNNLLTSKGAASLVINGNTSATIDPETTQITKDAIMLLSPGYTSQDHEYGEPETPEEVARYKQLMRDEGIRSSVFQARHGVLSKITSSNPDEYGPSLLHSKKMQSNIFFNEEDYENSIAYKAAIDPVSSPTQLLRHVVTAKAKQIDDAVLAYEQALNDEAIQALKLDVLIRSL